MPSVDDVLIVVSIIKIMIEYLRLGAHHDETTSNPQLTYSAADAATPASDTGLAKLSKAAGPTSTDACVPQVTMTDAELVDHLKKVRLRN